MVGAENGSVMEGVDEGIGGWGGKGGRESSRMASSMVGWKGPPWGSWCRRCVGRTWPRMKKVDMALWAVKMKKVVGAWGRVAHLFLKTMS